MPEFAQKLARRGMPQNAEKSPLSAFTSRGRPLPQDEVIYENGPVNGTTDAWTINFGYVVSDSFTGGGVDGFDIWVWEFPGDTVTSVDWSITSDPNGGTVYGSGTASVTDTFISTNQYGYNIDKISASGLNAGGGGTVYLNLQNAVIPSGDPVYWDENSGQGCHSGGCPSQAVESGVGTIPSEAFDITVGGFGYPPECVYDKPQDGFKVIHRFTDREAGGYWPASGVAVDKAGNLFGSLYRGGDYDQGLLYKLAQHAGGWLLSPLYSFAGGENGGDPGQVVLGPEGGLYGAADGGLQQCGSGGASYCGLVYNLKPSPIACLTALCSWSETVLYRFTGDPDGWQPNSNPVFDPAGNLYGITQSGGANGHGTVYELTPSAGGWTGKVIYSFTGSDGDGPNSLLVGDDGNLYGTTEFGGFDGHGGGVVFQLVPSGGGWTEQVIASFGPCTYWYRCYPSLIQESAGKLYGIGSYDRYFCNVNGPNYCYWDQFGIIFMMSPSDGKWQITVLDDTLDYYSGGVGLQEDGYDLFHDLTIDAAGRLYATEGGWVDCGGSPCPTWGKVFELTGPHQEHTLVSFKGNDFGPLVPGASGKLYGTTASCGTFGHSDNGTVWQLSP
jgi:uncharacterized repeat protein (TIGR03803 family)